MTRRLDGCGASATGGEQAAGPPPQTHGHSGGVAGRVGRAPRPWWCSSGSPRSSASCSCPGLVAPAASELAAGEPRLAPPPVHMDRARCADLGDRRAGGRRPSLGVRPGSELRWPAARAPTRHCPPRVRQVTVSGRGAVLRPAGHRQPDPEPDQPGDLGVLDGAGPRRRSPDSTGAFHVDLTTATTCRSSSAGATPTPTDPLNAADPGPQPTQCQFGGESEQRPPPSSYPIQWRARLRVLAGPQPSSPWR